METIEMVCRVVVWRWGGRGQGRRDGRGEIRKRKSRPGIALVWSAMVLFVMVLMVGLSIDWGKMVWNVHEMQNAADAAALAGAQVVKGDYTPGHELTVTRTHDFAVKNWADQLPVTLRTTVQPAGPDSDDPTVDIFLGRWITYDRSFFATLDGPNAVKASVRRSTGLGNAAPPLSLVFGPMAGTQTVDATRAAIAVCIDASSAGFLCLSSTEAPGLDMRGTAELHVAAGGIQVNSKGEPAKGNGNNDEPGAAIGNEVTIDCGYLNVVGLVDPEPGDKQWVGTFTDKNGTYHPFSVFEGTPPVSPVDDPVATVMHTQGDLYVDGSRLLVPELLGTVFPTRQAKGAGAISTTCSLAPGYYPYGIQLTKSNQTIMLDPTLDPGVPPIYIFGGAGGNNCGLYVTGGNLIGNGVTCYVTKSYGFGDKEGVISLTGNGIIHLTSPGDLSTTDSIGVDGRTGIALWQDPTMIDSKTGTAPEAHLNGGGDLQIKGTIYLPDPVPVRLEGNLGECGNQVICGTARLEGTAAVSVNYDGRNNPFQTHTSSLVK
jgi:hypothetical protein